MRESEVIYILKDEHGAVFYVGRTIDRRNRTYAHRKTFGATTVFEIIQDSFTSETPAAAEVRWIKFYLNQGAGLKNSVHVPNFLRLSHSGDDFSHWPTLDIIQCSILHTIYGLSIEQIKQMFSVAKKHGMAITEMVNAAICQFDNECQRLSDPVGESFPLSHSAGPISYEDARALYTRLSRFFAQRGANNLSAEERRLRGQRAAAKRWNCQGAKALEQ